MNNSYICRGLTQIKMKYINRFLIILIPFCFFSCNKNDSQFSHIDPSVSLIEMEGEGGETEISFTFPHWKIAGIINENGNVNISGNSYSTDGFLIRENHTLKLDSLGRVETLWSDKGFIITRDSYTSLKIFVRENSTGEDFNFIIKLESENEARNIQISQKRSQGYAFKKIEYELGQNDGDSLFLKTVSSFSFDLLSSQEFSFYPVRGIDKHSFFESQEEDAFVWTRTDSLPVRIPSGIWNNELYFNGTESIYSGSPVKHESEFNTLEVTVTLPAGKSEVTFQIQFRERRVSYYLYLVNNRTKEEKIIKGQWVETAPTGEYKINWRIE